MRQKRRKSADSTLNRRWLYGAACLIALILVTVNCTPSLIDINTAFHPPEPTAQNEPFDAGVFREENEQAGFQPLAAESFFISNDLWADVTDSITAPKPTHSSTTNITLDVRDANLLDVLSLLAYKLDVNIIFLGDPDRRITVKIANLSPLTTFQLILQKESLDYLVVGGNYIVAERGRLYEDFANRMLLTRYSLFYLSASAMQGYISELGVPVQSLTVDSNQRAIWMQGTPMTLGKARKLINSLDIMENAAFAEGGARKIRMPVAAARGARAEEELEALIDLLSILLDGFRDGRTDMGWVTWDHPDPIPYIFMDWESPIIKPYDIRMKITRDLNDNYSDQIRYLIAEGTPDNINLVNQMISAIGGTQRSPLGLSEPAVSEQNMPVNWAPSEIQSPNLPDYLVTLRAIPAEGGTLSGGGSYSQGSAVTIRAVAAEDYEFVRWIENGSEISTNQTYTFNIYAGRNFEAVFRLDLPGDNKAEGDEESTSKPDSQ